MKSQRTVEDINQSNINSAREDSSLEIRLTRTNTVQKLNAESEEQTPACGMSPAVAEEQDDV